MAVFYPIDNNNLFKYTGYYSNVLSSSQVTGAVWFYAPTCSIDTYSSSYLSESSWWTLKNMFYGPGCEQYNDQIKDGFYSVSVARFCYLPFFFKGDRVRKGYFDIYDIDSNITISDDGAGNLYDVSQNKMIIGNIFYQAGVAVLWENDEPEYINACSGSNWRIEVVSETDVWRNQWVFTIGQNELNYSQNPSSVTNYSYRMKGLGAINYSLKAAYIYTGSYPNRSKFDDQSGQGKLLDYFDVSHQTYDYFSNDGLHFPTMSFASKSAYSSSETIFSGSNTDLQNVAFLIVSQFNIKECNQNDSVESYFYLFNCCNGSPITPALWNGSSFISAILRQSTGSSDYAPENAPIVILSSKGRSNNYAGHVTWSDSVNYPTFNNIKQVAYYIDVNQNGGYLQRGIYINGTSSYISAIAPSNQATGFAMGPKTSQRDYFFVSGSTLTASSYGVAVPYSLISGTIGYVKLYQFAPEHKPSMNQLHTYLHEEYVSGSNNLADENGNYIINSYNNLPPYISEFGLYNDKNELIATGKFARPYPNDKDVPITINVSLDLV